MNVSSKVLHNIVVLTLAGRIDVSARTVLQSLINDTFHGYRYFVIHMQEVTFMDSSGLGALVACLTTIRRQGGIMYLVQVAPQAYELMEMTKLTHFFEICASEEEALARIEADMEQAETWSH